MSKTLSSKRNLGNFFEDFQIGQMLEHAAPLTITQGDVSLYRALSGGGRPLFSARPFAQSQGFRDTLIDPLLVFHTVFGQSVNDISRNAVANLGYAEGQFLAPVYAGDTLNAVSEIIGLKQTSNEKAGIVWVRTRGMNQTGECVLSYVRWVLVNKRDVTAPAPEVTIPDLTTFVSAQDLQIPAYTSKDWPQRITGSPHYFEDYKTGERIDHCDGITVEEAEHQIATRSFQNTAKVHFDAAAQASSRFGRRLIYGGVVISIAQGLGVNGLANAMQVLAINGGTHINPLFAGDTIYAASEVLDTVQLSENTGALRLRLVATKDTAMEWDTLRNESGKYNAHVLLDFDYWAAIPMTGNI